MRLFCIVRPRNAVPAYRDLGAASATLPAKRYGMAFSCAVVGKGGEIYFGEDDRGGHLWTYFPTILGDD